ncbi:MAG: YafY family transcriptional regulator [Roseibium sp.]|uniref:helix-turn-helix transcriptional regulator n=1 Tax=Roseibium sp. TaxID=1936156 RepID=UPI002628BC60|nr:YafY family protein [Roseibium sp.]MCV0428632.1 YafY family transcriptional regulator [Roseibium sp.]
MSRSDRLIRLMQVLRRLPSPVTASRLASEMEISERSIYRDIQSLRSAGAIIDGEAGYGYTLTEDPSLPPMHFEADEVDALALGLHTVSKLGNSEFSYAAQNALVKLEASLPENMRHRLRHSPVGSHLLRNKPSSAAEFPDLREAIWNELAVQIEYLDLSDRFSNRKVWPLTIYFFNAVQALIAWCCLRQDFRMFRLDRIKSIEILEESFRPKRVGLLREYFDREKECE